LVYKPSTALYRLLFGKRSYQEQRMDSHSHHGHHHHDSDTARHSSIVASPDKPFTDPVCGMKVAAIPERTTEYSGTAYHFCSAGCMTKFRGNPQAYLAPKNAEQTPAPAAPEGTIYTCLLRIA
jgi:Cu+-exporting ATPase